MNQYYENLYLKNTNEEQLHLFEYFLDFFNINKEEFYISGLSPFNMEFCSKKDKNIKGIINFSNDGILFEFRKQVFFNDEREVLAKRIDIFDYLNSYKPFFTDEEIDFSDKLFSYIMKDTVSDFKKRYKPEENNYAYTNEEILNLGEGTFKVYRMIKNNGDKVLSCAVFNYFIEKEFDVKPDNSAFVYLDEAFKNLIRVSRPSVNMLELHNFASYRDLLFFDKNGCLTKESKELLELNFQY